MCLLRTVILKQASAGFSILARPVNNLTRASSHHLLIVVVDPVAPSASSTNRNRFHSYPNWRRQHFCSGPKQPKISLLTDQQRRESLLNIEKEDPPKILTHGKMALGERRDSNGSGGSSANGDRKRPFLIGVAGGTASGKVRA